MGLIARLLTRFVKRTSLADPAAASIFGVRPTLSGVSVTDSTALESPAYFAGVRNVSEDLATLPLIVYKRIGDTRRERDSEHRLYALLHDAPNPEMDAVQFFEMQQAWLMMQRNAYAEIVRNGAGAAVELWPIPPERMIVRRIEGELWYQVILLPDQKDPVTGQTFTMLDRSRVLHVKAFALDGVMGRSSITMHQESIGLSLALERYGAAYFGNDATPGGFLEHPGVMSAGAKARLLASMEARHQGVDRSHRIGLLEEGMKFTAAVVENDKAQFVASQRNQTEQMARINRVPPHLIGDLARATFSNIEHQAIDYTVHTIRPWAVRWERAIVTQVFTAAERRTHYPEFLLDALLRGDALTRAQTLAIQRQNGVINADEWRELDNRNPTEDDSGKAYLVNGNMLPVEAILRKAEEPEPAPPPPTIIAPPPPEPTPEEPTDTDENLRRVFLPLFRAAAERIVRREAAAFAKAIDRVFAARGMAEFEAWAAGFFADHAATARQAFLAPVLALGESIRGADGRDLSEWAVDHASRLAKSRGIKAGEAVRAAIANRTPQDGLQALRGLPAEWLASGAEIMALSELQEAIGSARRYLADAIGFAA
jgi:HK97 family phage portal protein